MRHPQCVSQPHWDTRIGHMRATRSCHCGAAADDSQRQPTIATGKTCMKWTIAAVLRSTCLLYLRKLFLLPEATAKVCKLPVAIVGCRRLSSAVACKLPVAIVRQSSAVARIVEGRLYRTCPNGAVKHTADREDTRLRSPLYSDDRNL